MIEIMILVMLTLILVALAIIMYELKGEKTCEDEIPRCADCVNFNTPAYDDPCRSCLKCNKHIFFEEDS
jgi:hypothetical protein